MGLEGIEWFRPFKESDRVCCTTSWSIWEISDTMAAIQAILREGDTRRGVPTKGTSP